MFPTTPFQIEDFQKDDLTITVQIEGREAVNISVKEYEKWLKESGHLDVFDDSFIPWAKMNPEAYWERSEFFTVQDLYEYILQSRDLVNEIMQEDL